MIEIPTVLVLGAGASAPFGFPSGQTLVDIIFWYFWLVGPDGPTFGEEPWDSSTINELKQMLMARFPKEEIVSLYTDSGSPTSNLIIDKKLTIFYT